MAFEKRDLLHKLEAMDRDQVWENMTTLATNAAVIVVIAFMIALVCVGVP